MPVAHQVLVERRQRCEPAADRRRGHLFDLAHKALPGYHRLVVGLARFLGAHDRQRAHEVLYVEPIRTAGAHTLLLGDQISSSGMLASWAMIGTWAVAAGAGQVVLSALIVPLGFSGISRLL